MAETSWAILRNLLADRYDDYKIRLTRRLGSEELASESLHETWLRLHRQDDVGAVRNPAAYLLRIAVNIATDRRRAESRRARHSEIRAVLDIADQAPGPGHEVEARMELETLQRAIAELPERSRIILTAARIEGLPHQAIADRLGLSKRMIQIELKRAVAYCQAQLERDAALRCASKSPEAS